MIREMTAKSLVVLLALSLAIPSGLPAQQATQAKSGKAAFTPQQLDELTAPVALYPDALLAQMLTCSQSYFQVKELSEFLKKNSQLKGSAVQDAAQKEGFDASFVALSTFPDVVHMMAEKADWTKKLGQAFTADQDGVFGSIQRLRAQAQQQGNLKTTQQQEVVTQKTEGGTQVIVIQPANPQVVYVPQYNPTVVYTQPAPPPQPSTSSVVGAALIGFTAGVIIGAAADNHYWGPYGWRGGYMYHDAWHHREDARDDWYEHRENMSENRQQNYDQRQDNRQQNVDSRQANQDSRQTSRQSNQDTRQTSRQANQDTRQQTTAANQSSRQSAQAANQSARQTSASQARTTSYDSRGYGAQTSQQRSGTRSSAFSGYGSGSSERSASARGNSSMKSSRGSRGGRSR
jgi:hypothetical protein